ncbi:hypothetical protein BH09BAC5_BH09BAC5_11980 [soil metagenome]
MKKTLNILLAALFCIPALANTHKADRLFAHWEYYRAAKLYQKETIKHPSADVYYMLGECYRKMNNNKIQEQAADDKVNSYGTYSKPEFYLHYGQVLKSNGKNTEAKVAFDKYTELVPNDPRGKFYSESIDITTEDHKYDEPIVVTNVGSINSPSAEFCPVLYKDGIVFTSTRKTSGHGKTYGWTGGNYNDLYFAKKGNSNTDYANATAFGGKKIDKKYHDGPACFSKNNDTMFVSRVEKDLKGEQKKSLGIERNKIYMFTLDKDKDEWINEVPFAFNSDSFSVSNPFLTADGSRLYFVSDMAGGYGETDIYYCNREGNSWSKPVNMGPNVNTFNREKYPNVDKEGNFYFASDGYQGFGGMDICVALNQNGSLQKAIPLKAPFNSSNDDFGIIFLEDGKTGYINSNRSADGKGDDDILYFDVAQDKIDTSLVTSIYTIGYRPKLKTEILVVKKDSVIKVPTIVFAEQNPVAGTIYFDFDESVLRPDAIPYLDSVVTYMKRYPNMLLIVGGHCDERGTADYNMILSNQRNAAAITYLTSKGISRKRITATGYGLTRMVNKCENGVECTEPEQQLNRRVEFTFAGDKKSVVKGSLQIE